VFEALGNHAQGERLHAGDGFVAIGTVAYYSGQCRHFGQPPATSSRSSSMENVTRVL